MPSLHFAVITPDFWTLGAPLVVRESRTETEEWGGRHPGYRVQATLTVFSHTYLGVRSTGVTVDTMVTEAGTRLVKSSF